MFRVDLAIKFGGNEIGIYRKGFGIIAKEPAFVAVVENGNKMKIKATGKQAQVLFFGKNSDVTVYQPIQDGEVKNEKVATLLISHILSNAIQDKMTIQRVNAIVAVPCALTEEQLLVLKKVLNSSGIDKVTFVQNGVCAYENLEQSGHVMVVDIGKTVTDISVLSKDNFEKGRTYFIGGADMDASITTYIMDNYNLEVSDLTSEAIKNEIASLYERDTFRTKFVGIDSNNSLKKESISANEIKVAIVNLYNTIIELAREFLNTLPKEVISEVKQNGIVFVGGASKVSGLYEFAKSKLDCPVIVPDFPEDYILNGAGKLLNKKNDFIKIDL